MLSVRQEKLGDVLIFRLEGSLSALEAPSFKKQVRSVMAEGATEVVLDLGQVEFVDSAGLGSLVALHKSAEKGGGSLKVYRPLPNVYAVLELARIHRFLNVVQDGPWVEATETK